MAPDMAKDPGTQTVERNQTDLDALRRRIATLESAADWPTAPTGVAAIDHCLPRGGLATGCLHALAGAIGPVAGFAVAQAIRLSRAVGRRRVVWLAAGEPPCGMGLAAAGLASEALLLVHAPRRRDRLWALEETLRCRDVAVVVAELDRIDMTAGRRLSLAAEAGGAAGLLIPPPVLRVGPSETDRAAGPDAVGGNSGFDIAPTAAATRWVLAGDPAGPGRNDVWPGGPAELEAPPWGGAASGPAGDPARPGRRRWRWTLARCRGGRTGSWLVEEGDAPGDFRLVSPFHDRSHGRPAAPRRAAG